MSKELDFKNPSAISMEDFLRAGGMEPATTLEQEKAAALNLTTTTTNSKGKSKAFGNKHFQLFSLPLVSVYLKGMLIDLPLNCTLAEALKVAYVRQSGGKTHAELSNLLVDYLQTTKGKLYTADFKDTQISLLNKVTEVGLTPVLSKCMSKARALAQLEAFNAGRLEQLEAMGCKTLEEYAILTGKVTPIEHIDPIDFADF